MTETQWDDTNRGAMFQNDKGDNPSRPDYRGTLNVEGTEYWISAWYKKSRGGLPYISIGIQPKTANGASSYPQQERRPIPAVNQPVDTSFDDPIPF